MNDENEKLEALLGRTSLIRPTPILDERIAQLLAPPPRRLWQRIIGPAVGFAAGVLVTASIALSISQQTRHASPAAPAPKIAPVEHATLAAPPAQTTLALWAQPQRVTNEIDGFVNGVPVRLEQTREQLILSPMDQSSPVLPSHMVIPQSDNIHALATN